MEATSYHDYKKVAMDAVLDSHHRLANEFELLMVEGAGSPAEINLRENDIANMGYAEAVDCPVILVADIDRGGVFAHLVGTLELLSTSEQNRVKGFIINRFRGDIKLLESGLDWLEAKTGKPVLGVLPYLHDLALDAEDAVAIENTVDQAKINIVVPLLPHISNHTDFDTLRLNPEINLRYVKIGERINDCELVILPGSKNVISDLKFLKEQGWQNDIERHLRYGGKVFGICGGYQMLGQVISDPHGIESNLKTITGLGLLDIVTELTPEKVLSQVSATMVLGNKSCLVRGYEIHCGISKFESRSELNDTEIPTDLLIDKSDNQATDGCVSNDNQIAGTYLHGIFDEGEATQLLVDWLDSNNDIQKTINLNEHREHQLERLADVCQKHLKISVIEDIIKDSKTTEASSA
jgi:adenosylcobyric acid synthase